MFFYSFLQSLTFCEKNVPFSFFFQKKERMEDKKECFLFTKKKKAMFCCVYRKCKVTWFCIFCRFAVLCILLCKMQSETKCKALLTFYVHFVSQNVSLFFSLFFLSSLFWCFFFQKKQRKKERKTPKNTTFCETKSQHFGKQNVQQSNLVLCVLTKFKF